VYARTILCTLTAGAKRCDGRRPEKNNVHAMWRSKDENTNLCGDRLQKFLIKICNLGFSMNWHEVLDYRWKC